MNVLLTFTGFQDPYAIGLVGQDDQPGPILSLVGTRSFDRIILFSTPGTEKNTSDTKAALLSLYPKTSIEVRDLPLHDPTDYVAILRALRVHIRDIADGMPHAMYSIAVASGTPQMHACWVMLAASGEIPAHILDVRPPRFVSKDRPLVCEVDLSATDFPLVRSNICSVETPDVSLPDLDTVLRELRIVGDHPAIRKALEMGAALASSMAPILIVGETGTGKELFARFVHRLSGRRLDRFVPVNCAAIPEDLVESILFGHKKGSFTGATGDQVGKFDLADGGTLFLDELAELPLPSQAKLLRVLQDGIVEPLGEKKGHKVNVRVIAATNQDLRKAIQHGRFREDLFYRFDVKRRFLIERPTGTGKTDLICLYLKRLIQAGRAERILFLVDRDQLAKQALEAIQDILDQYGSYWLRPGMVRQEQQITVCLLQTMISRYQEFTSGYFDVVIADESHCSIYGAWQTALTHFDATHIGLTATPEAYIERNTYTFYQCKDGEPDFSYPIQEAFKAGYLAPYKFATGITVLLAEGADVDDEHYDPVEFERKWTDEDTNRKMMQEVDRLAWENYQELAPGQKIGAGKSIVFAITKHHAARLTDYLNQLHPEHQGRYAEVITSDVMSPDELIRKFKREDYPQVAVSVGMLDTGFDCREVLHLVMCRRVRSPILYQQMRGRGTRTAPHIGKQKFVIYDFFGNHDYFNDSDTDIFTGTGSGRAAGAPQTPQKSPRELIELGLEDEWLEAVTYVEVGPEDERIDKRD